MSVVDLRSSDGPSEHRLGTMKRSSSRPLNYPAVFEQVFLINHLIPCIELWKFQSKITFFSNTTAILCELLHQEFAYTHRPMTSCSSLRDNRLSGMHDISSTSLLGKSITTQKWGGSSVLDAMLYSPKCNLNREVAELHSGVLSPRAREWEVWIRSGTPITLSLVFIKTITSVRNAAW